MMIILLAPRIYASRTTGIRMRSVFVGIGGWGRDYFFCVFCWDWAQVAYDEVRLEYGGKRGQYSFLLRGQHTEAYPRTKSARKSIPAHLQRPAHEPSCIPAYMQITTHVHARTSTYSYARTRSHFPKTRKREYIFICANICPKVCAKKCMIRSKEILCWSISLSLFF